MLNQLRKLLGKSTAPAAHALPPGERVYAIGDIHGRIDLFEALIHAIESDDMAAPPSHQTTIILLGDLVDRGPGSKEVVARAREWQAQRTVRILAGNHEQMFLDSFDSSDVLRHFLRHGGRQTLMSYGLSEEASINTTLDELRALMPALVPPHDRAFIAGFENYVAIGDFLFVHAGIRPEVPLEDQSRHDMLWIREPFLSYENSYPFMVVHGHTIFETVDERPNRIGIDTGAFRSGNLTALVLEGSSRRYIQAVEDDGLITIHKGESAT